MAVHIDLLSIILLSGVLQGLILAGVLIFRAGKRPQPYFLAAFMLVLAYDMFDTLCWTAALGLSWADLLNTLFPYTALFTLGPSFYLYVRTMAGAEPLRFKSIFRTYSPALADLLIRLIIITYAIAYNHGKITDIAPNKIDRIYHWVAEPLLPVMFCIYIILAINCFRPNARRPAMRWTKVLLWMMCGVAVIWAFTIFFAMLFSLQTSGHWLPLEAILIILIYWVSFTGYYRPQKAKNPEAVNCLPLLIKAMAADQLYLDPDLTVIKLADHLGLNIKLVSAALNGTPHQGFNRFVNGYRVDAVKRQLLLPENDQLTLLGIAQNCGFNSQATFQRVFREFTGHSPSEYRRNCVQIRI